MLISYLLKLLFLHEIFWYSQEIDCQWSEKTAQYWMLCDKNYLTQNKTGVSQATNTQIQAYWHAVKMAVNAYTILQLLYIDNLFGKSKYLCDFVDVKTAC